MGYPPAGGVRRADQHQPLLTICEKVIVKRDLLLLLESHLRFRFYSQTCKQYIVFYLI